METKQNHTKSNKTKNEANLTLLLCERVINKNFDPNVGHYKFPEKNSLK